MVRPASTTPPDTTPPDLDGLDLPAIDLTGDADADTVLLDRRSFEDQYAELGFGLGTARRRQRRDDAWWETAPGLLVCVLAMLFVLWLTTA